MRYLTRILAILIFLPLTGWGQRQVVDVKLKNAVADSTFKIEYVISDARIPGYLNVHIRVMMADTIPSLQYIEDSLQFSEISSGNKESRPIKANLQKVIPQQFDLVTIIMDVSSSMWRQQGGQFVHMDSAKKVVDSLLSAFNAPYATRLYTYDEQLYNRTFDGENSIQTVQKPLDARYTHLWESVDAALSRMAEGKGRKILIVVGDGENDHNKNKPVTVTREQLIEKIRGLDDSYYIFPVAFGTKVYPENLMDLVNSTKATEDSVSYSVPRPGMFKVVKDIKRWPITHTLLVKSERHPHAGELRDIVARLESRTDTAQYHLGGLFNPWHEESNWQADVFFGGLLLVALLIIFAIVVPNRRWKDFKKKYVRHYWEVKTDGQRRYDPLTKFPFRDDDLVVVRCEHMTSMETWQYEGRGSGKESNNRKRKNRCIYYPHKCETGSGPGGSADFFSQKGVFKQLFWVFAGALGGFLGWGLWAMFETAKKLDWHKRLDEYAMRPDMQERWGLPAGVQAPQEDMLRFVRERFLDPFFEQIVLGALATIFIVFLIALANEIAQARSGFRGLTILAGILRSALRALIAGIFGAALFMGFGLLQSYIFGKYAYLPGLATMLLLGIICGRILTTASGIRHNRGFWAGLAAGFIGFHLYFIPLWLFGLQGYEVFKLVGFMGFGGILGLLMSHGSPALEASEVEVWTGFKRYGMAHITDLLRKNEEVSVGRGPKATIRMKVRYTPVLNAPGNVVQTFARFVMRNEVVFLVPEVFTEVNGEPVAPNERVPLFHGDKISFTNKSPSHLRYVEHRAGPHPRWRSKRRRDRRVKRARAKALAERVRGRAKEEKKSS